MTATQIVENIREMNHILSTTSPGNQIPVAEDDGCDEAIILRAMGIENTAANLSAFDELHTSLKLMTIALCNYEITSTRGFGLVLSSDQWHDVKIVIIMEYLFADNIRLQVDKPRFTIEMYREGKEYERSDIPEIDDVPCIMTADETEELVKNMSRILLIPNPPATF